MASREVDSSNLLWEMTQYKNANMLPAYLSDVNAWHGHVPFAFFITQLLAPETFVELGVHAGDSYMAFCQGLKQIGGHGRAFGVDTFEGDEHSGAYDKKMYDLVSGVHDPLFGSFSKLLVERFETAVGRFDDGSINLLHIDGCHKYEAAKRDFNMWLPKMAPNGVILMHDTSVTAIEDFGVWRFWGEIRREYPCFEFYDSNGLGVACVGAEPNEVLLAMSEEDKSWQGEWVRQYFDLLAQRVYAQRNGRLV